MGIILFFAFLMILFFFVFKESDESKSFEEKLASKYEEMHERIHEKYEAKKRENQLWSKQWNKLIKKRNLAKSYEDSKQYKKAISEYINCIAFGESSNKLIYKSYIHDIDRVIILYGKSKQKEKLKKFLKVVIQKYPNSRRMSDWKRRLSKISPTLTVNQKKLIKDQIVSPSKNPISLGERINNFKQSLPEFNFYYDLPINMGTLIYLKERQIVSIHQTTNYRKLKDAFNVVIDEAKIAENNQDYKQAIEIYLKLITEGYEERLPYDRLMILYRKFKWADEEAEILTSGINFFKTLKTKQKKEVLELADKYGKTAFALDYIKNNKRIQYYGGLFDLYNPFLFIDKWEKRLLTLKHKL